MRAIKGHDFNLAQPSATVDALLLQARQAVTLKPKPGLFLVQIMDANMVCPATHGDYATFRSKLITALGVLARGAPHSRIFVVSQWGSPTTYWKALRPAQRQQFVAAPGWQRHRPVRVHRSPRPARAQGSRQA